MATLYTGSAEVQSGVEYINLAGTANAMQTTEKTRISINRTPFSWFPAYTKIFVATQFTYSFESDTVVLFAVEIEPDFYVTTIDYNTNDIDLADDTESGAIITLAEQEGKAITSGSITAQALVSNDANQDGSCIIRLHGSTIGLISSLSKDIPRNSTGEIVLINVNLPDGLVELPAGEDVHFTLEASNGSMTVEGATTPSQLRLFRKNL